MARGRGAPGPDFRPDAVWSELPKPVQGFVRDTLEREGLSVGDWPEVSALRTALVYMAASVRVARLREASTELSRTGALEHVAHEFGLEASTLRRMFWRATRAVDQAAS